MKLSKETLSSAVLFIISLLCHLPFLNAGYGREEDAWAQALNAKVIWESGQYQVSRLPGHPLLELLLAGLWPLEHSPFFFNLLSAVVTALAVVFFFKIARRLDLKNPFTLALAFSFVPVFFIAGSYTIDYNYALLFILISLCCLIRRQYLWAGIFLGIATGFRISSLAFLLPYSLMLYRPGREFRAYLKLWLMAGAVAFLSFLPPLLRYGSGFFDFHKPPLISWPHSLYKLSLGIWGLPLLLFLGGAAIYILLKRRQQWRLKENIIGSRQMLIGIAIIALLQLAVFIRLPFKSEFFIPLVPFVIFLAGMYLRGKQIRLLAVIALISCLGFGFDYASPQRGATPGSNAWIFEAGGKRLFLDPWQGPALIDLYKRHQKSAFVKEVQEEMQAVPAPLVLIAGWYWPELVLKTADTSKLKLRYYLTETELEHFRLKNYDIYYLPEINEANAQIRGHYLADSLAQPLIQP